MNFFPQTGYDVTTYQDPEKALKCLRSQPFDIVITDLQMPKYSGIEIAQAARNISDIIEVIVISGYSSIESAVDAMKEGVYDYIHKPFNMSAILSTVTRAAERVRLQKHNLELSKKIEKALTDVTTLHEISKIINTSEETDEILNFALSTIETSLGIDMATMMLHTDDEDEFIIKKSVEFTNKSIEKFKIQRNNGIIGQAVRDNEAVHVSGYEKDSHFISGIAVSDKKKIQNFSIIPLNAQNQLVGLITIHQLDVDKPEDNETLKLLEVMSVQIAPMIRLGQYFTERKSLISDAMSGAKIELLNIIKKAGKYRGTLSVLIFKLYLKNKANFSVKIFNIGDLAFDYMKKSITPIDSAVKIGIDAFMVILQGKTKITCEEDASRIKEIVEADKTMKKNGILLDYGYADFPMDGTTFEDLVSKAQANLWKFVVS